MINPTPKQAKTVLTILEPAQYARLVRVIMGLRSPEQWKEPLDSYRQLQMYVYEWLVHLGFLADDKVRWLMNHMDSEMRAFGRWLDAEYDNIPCVPKPSPIFILTITDKRYAVWPRQAAFADLQDEVFVNTREQLGGTHIAGDFLEIFTVKQRWLKRLHGGKDGHQHHGDDRPADDGRAGGQDEDDASGSADPDG